MFAVVDILGQQLKVTEKGKYFVPRMNEEPESEVSFDKVVMIGDDNKIKVGTPYVKDAKVSAKVIGHMRDDKVLVFKKKRRTGYKKLNGHRQHYTQIEVTSIG